MVVTIQDQSGKPSTGHVGRGNMRYSEIIVEGEKSDTLRKIKDRVVDLATKKYAENVSKLTPENLSGLVRAVAGGMNILRALNIQDINNLANQVTHSLATVAETDKSYQPPTIEVGDEVKVGKFKNRKAEVKGITTDENNQPVLKTTRGDQKLFKPRISKLEDK